MLYVLYGTDTAKSRSKLAALLSTLLSKKPDAMVLRSDQSTFSDALIADYIESQGLFEQKSIIVLDMLFENKMHQKKILDSLKEIQASENVFILLEGKLDVKTKSKLEKHSAKVQEFVLPKVASKSNDFNIFELSDALGARNRKKLWVIFQEGRMHNISGEEMHGILFWSVKNMLLSKEENNAKDAGLSSFVFQKSKSNSSRYSKEELQSLSSGLVSLYHNARRGLYPLDIGLEKFLLDLK